MYKVNLALRVQNGIETIYFFQNNEQVYKGIAV
jgi:hypothetical protein